MPIHLNGLVADATTTDRLREARAARLARAAKTRPARALIARESRPRVRRGAIGESGRS